jgi:calcineurin-like phosphoesterase family protein
MDAQLIANWNDKVQPDDHVFHLGDFCYGCKPDSYIGKLNGNIHLINGSHDKWANEKTCVGFDGHDKRISVDDYAGKPRLHHL